MWISKQKEYQMVPDTNTAKKDVHCAVFFWIFKVHDVHVVVLFWEPNQGIRDCEKRRTIVLDEDDMKKLCIIQAQLLKKPTQSVSFSSVIADVLRKEL